MNNWTFGLIGASWLIWIAYWIVSAFDVKKTVERPGKYRFKFFIILIFAAWVLLKPSHGFFQHLTIWHAPIGLGIFCDILVLGGLVTTIWARHTLGRNWSAQITFKKDHELIENGPYSYARHPIYTGIILMAIGTAIDIGQVPSFALLFLLLVGIYVKYKNEEKLMLKHFPEKYAAYQNKVKAIIPFVF